MAKRILLVGGGSGGHFFPLVAVAESLRKIDPMAELLILGEGPFFSTVAGAFPAKRIMAGKFRRYLDVRTLLDPFKAVVGFFQSLWILFWYMPDVVFCKGGYVSVMPALVARIYAIPVYTHESDAVPGLANRLIGKLARTIFISFARAASYFKNGKTILVGNPIRPEILAGQRDVALTAFNFRADKKTIFVSGGSQGAKRINSAIIEALVLLVQEYQVIHQCGESQMASVKAETDRLEKEGSTNYGPMIRSNYRLYSFLPVDQLALAYAAADVIISRGGASNLFEIAALGKPAIVIPITKSSSDHQIYNAREFQTYGGVMIEESNLEPHILLSQIKELLEPTRYRAISAQIKTFAKLDAADQIAKMLLA